MCFHLVCISVLLSNCRSSFRFSSPDRKVALDLFRRYGVVLSNAIDFCEEYLRRPPEPTALPAFSAAFNYSHGFPGPTPGANMSHLFTTPPPKKADDEEEEEEEIKAPKKKPQVTVPELLRTFIFNSSRCLSGARQHFQRQVLLDLVVTQLHMDWLLEEQSFVRHNASIDSIFITTGGGTTRVFPERWVRVKWKNGLWWGCDFRQYLRDITICFPNVM